MNQLLKSFVAFSLGLGLVGLIPTPPSFAQQTDAEAEKEFQVVSFKRTVLTDKYFAEGAGFGDLNHDSHVDIVSGPYWYEGPTFEEKHQFYDGKSFPNDRGYSDNFFSYVDDFNGDEWDDILVIGLPGTPAHWYANPKQSGEWKKYVAFEVVDNEAPTFADLTGDGRPELVCTHQGRIGYLQPREGQETLPWSWIPISDEGPWHRYSHGLGVGDVNGDGFADVLMPEGWWPQPLNQNETLPWKQQAQKFSDGGAQIYAVDVDGDGDNDVISSQQAHAWGLNWYEQTDEAGKTQFKTHPIMGASKDDNPFGVAFSQLHAIDCRDVDGDGRVDIVAGKCYWAHNGADPGARDPSVLYWFRNTVTDRGIEFIPHLIDDDSGVGRQISVVDVNDDGLVDVVTSNKKGCFVFLQSRRSASKQEWLEAQPKRLPTEANDQDR